MPYRPLETVTFANYSWKSIFDRGTWACIFSRDWFYFFESQKYPIKKKNCSKEISMKKVTLSPYAKPVSMWYNLIAKSLCANFHSITKIALFTISAYICLFVCLASFKPLVRYLNWQTINAKPSKIHTSIKCWKFSMSIKMQKTKTNKQTNLPNGKFSVRMCSWLINRWPLSKKYNGKSRGSNLIWL